MKSIKIESTLEVIDDWSALTTEDRALCLAAFEAMDHSYSPYSKFKVGAAVRMANGTIIKGANQENAVYPLGLCAERVALFTATGHNSGEPVVSLAVCTDTKLEKGELPPFPCGSCRQTMIETEKRYERNIRLLVFGGNKEVYVMNTVKDILPFAFDDSYL